ncbi:PilZ domain-containing protein [Novosphingobium sp. FSW06-99]|uniref:PilZ domain-containing protein n=1 Tax=Novosphingobium sp. FSW06-99 TaxID=1739113 RepID=UPI0009EC1471|nr:PilZ domain-containing protein [Novosphingobium sp. FSW06-99]
MHSEGQEPPGGSDPSGSPRPDSPPSDSHGLSHAGAEQRGAPRFALLLRVAKLVVDGRERFCVIRDASATGLKVRLFAPLPHPAALWVELANGDRHRVECMWTASDHAGLRFVEPIQLDHLLDEARSTGKRRHVRLRMTLDGVLHSGHTAVPVIVRDISQQGAGLESQKWLLINELVRIELPVLPAIYAKVRWRDHPHYGVIFEQIFQLEDLARRCAGLPAPLDHGRDSGNGA